MDKKIHNSVEYRSLSQSERAVFASTVATLEEKGLFDPGDIAIIASYARNVCLARKAAEDVEAFGVVLTFKDRGEVKYKSTPAIDVLQKAQNAYESTAIKLGLTPTGRKRLKGEGKPKKTALEQFNEQFDEQA